MEIFKQWAFSVCAAAVAGGIAHMILPKSGLSKIFSLTASVFFLCALLSPLLLSGGELRLEWNDYSDRTSADTASRLEEIAREHVEERARGAVRELIKDKLDAAGLSYKKIEASVNTGDKTAYHLTR